jgi:hypothetical protein
MGAMDALQCSEGSGRWRSRANPTLPLNGCARVTSKPEGPALNGNPVSCARNRDGLRNQALHSLIVKSTVVKSAVVKSAIG